MKARVSPVVRLSIGLAALTISVLLGAELFGILPDQTKSALDARQKISESLALQLSWAAINNDRRAIEETLEILVTNNPDILSASLQSTRLGTVAEFGDHTAHWAPPDDGRSTPTSVQVPIFNDRGSWGSLQLSFKPIRPVSEFATWKSSTAGLLTFVGILGFIVFALFLKRALRELDPSRVIPDHVKSAFDSLAEGVLIMDDGEHIVLANKAFSELIGIDSSNLVGRKVSQLGWHSPKAPVAGEEPVEVALPWQYALTHGAMRTGVPLRLGSAAGDERILLANGSPILDGDGGTRGALATFDDVSELQKNNVKLQNTLHDLAESKEEVNRQNKELRFLATRDPLTHCLNRRAMLENFEILFAQARVENQPLCFAMVDIDHFKSFNDRYGHAAGDKVIKFVANAMQSSSRAYDIVARYGGEEFCIIMPGTSGEEGVAAADRVRMNIKKDFKESFTSSRDLTVSIGISNLIDVSDSMNGIMKRADDALYAAKNAGRNQVIEWTDALHDGDDTHDRRADDAETLAPDASMLLPILEDPTETLTLASLNDQVMEMDALLEQKSGQVHRKHGFDDLTGLPNRLLFYDRVLQVLASAQRDGNAAALLYIDIDLHQRVGDELAPVTMDPALKIASERLAEVLDNLDNFERRRHGEEHSMSRLGHNEFGIVLPDLVDSEAATWIVQRLFDALDKPIVVNGEDLFANCSVGISLYPNDGDDAETLVGRASQARHLAHSKSGRNQFLYYAEEMNVRSYEQMQLESHLRKALEKDEFLLHYQPNYDLRSGRIIGFEALLRWNSPEMGVVGPAMFIHIAEQSGLIVPIGEWVMREACAQAQRWRDDGLGEIRIAVNLSAVQMRSDKLEDMVLNILEDTGLEPDLLELEVTETALLDNVAKVSDSLQGLRAKGITVAMDDFGTGYSSLSHLKHMVVDKLKIDRSFVRDVMTDNRDAAVVRSIIAMAKLLGMGVVAEGVETNEQLDFLRKNRCDMAQGYLLSQPVPADNASELLAEQRDIDQNIKNGQPPMKPLPDVTDTQTGLHSFLDP